jgi:hypothetical protein
MICHSGLLILSNYLRGAPFEFVLMFLPFFLRIQWPKVQPCLHSSSEAWPSPFLLWKWSEARLHHVVVVPAAGARVVALARMRTPCRRGRGRVRVLEKATSRRRRRPGTKAFKRGAVAGETASASASAPAGHHHRHLRRARLRGFSRSLPLQALSRRSKKEKWPFVLCRQSSPRQVTSIASQLPSRTPMHLGTPFSSGHYSPPRATRRAAP